MSNVGLPTVSELMEDRRRLEFMMANPVTVSRIGAKYRVSDWLRAWIISGETDHDTPRAAIDAAIQLKV